MYLYKTLQDTSGGPYLTYKAAKNLFIFVAHRHPAVCFLGIENCLSKVAAESVTHATSCHTAQATARRATIHQPSHYSSTNESL